MAILDARSGRVYVVHARNVCNLQSVSEVSVFTFNVKASEGESA